MSTSLDIIQASKNLVFFKCQQLIHSTSPLIQVDDLLLYLHFGSHRKELYLEALTECPPADGWSQPFHLSVPSNMDDISKLDAHYINPILLNNFCGIQQLLRLDQPLFHLQWSHIS